MDTITVSAIAAVSIDGVFSKRNDGGIATPNWTSGRDEHLFHCHTTFDPIIMGSGTFVSPPEKYIPLNPKRGIIVVSGRQRSELTKSRRVMVISNLYTALEEAKKMAKACKRQQVWILGGKKTLQDALERGLVDKLIVTTIDEMCGPANGVFGRNWITFPQLIEVEKAWEYLEINDVSVPKLDEFDGPGLIITTYTRK